MKDIKEKIEPESSSDKQRYGPDPAAEKANDEYLTESDIDKQIRQLDAITKDAEAVPKKRLPRSVKESLVAYIEATREMREERLKYLSERKRLEELELDFQTRNNELSEDEVIDLAKREGEEQ